MTSSSRYNPLACSNMSLTYEEGLYYMNLSSSAITSGIVAYLALTLFCRFVNWANY
jgi:hypothetical protein